MAFVSVPAATGPLAAFLNAIITQLRKDPVGVFESLTPAMRDQVNGLLKFVAISDALRKSDDWHVAEVVLKAGQPQTAQVVSSDVRQIIDALSGTIFSLTESLAPPSGQAPDSGYDRGHLYPQARRQEELRTLSPLPAMSDKTRHAYERYLDVPRLSCEPDCPGIGGHPEVNRPT